MIEWLDPSPGAQVAPDEYARLLGYPPGHEPEARSRELSSWARGWYAEHGRPWIYARQVHEVLVDEASVSLEGHRYRSTRLARLFREAGATSAVLVAVSAGEELERTSDARWAEGKPDEYYFLEIFGSTLVEHLVMLAGARLCAWADSAPLAVLPHDSPGYPEWDIAEQPKLLAQLRGGAGMRWPAPIEALESGALLPKKSLLAVFGLTPHVERVRRLTTLVPCQSCALAGCQYRRLPYDRDGRGDAEGEGTGTLSAGTGTLSIHGCLSPSSQHQPAPELAPIDLAAGYRVHQRALRRWAEERLMLHVEPDGSLTAAFRYDGTTCTNMGRPLAFLYEVRLGPRGEGFPVRALRCAPAPGDTGHRAMCGYTKDADALMQAIAADLPPVIDVRLDEALRWTPHASPVGCYCEREAREHKWGLVLETIHFALARREAAGISA